LKAPAAEEEAATDKEGEKKGAFQQLFGMLENSLSTNVEILEKKKWQRKVVNEVRSMEEFQLLLQEEKGPIIMEVGFTFCKPCKKFEPKYVSYSLSLPPPSDQEESERRDQMIGKSQQQQK